jgi:hypothetical protein
MAGDKKAIQRRLTKYAGKKHLTGAAKNRYIYGGLTNIKKRKGKGKRK